MTSSIDVIVPVFNEADGLRTFYDRMRALPLDYRLVFIDNASTDNSVEIIESFDDVTLIRHSENEGYGGSLLDGIANSDQEFIIIIDADCEFPPECLPELAEAVKQQPVVYASRLLGKRSAAEANMPYLKMLGNQIISRSFNFLFRQNTTDLYTGCKALRRDVLDTIELKKKGYEHVLEMGAKLADRGIKISEIPVDFSARSTGTSKMRHVSETTKFLCLILSYYFLSCLGKLNIPQEETTSAG